MNLALAIAVVPDSGTGELAGRATIATQEKSSEGRP
jgi:hypothetical protein